MWRACCHRWCWVLGDVARPCALTHSLGARRTPRAAGADGVAGREGRPGPPTRSCLSPAVRSFRQAALGAPAILRAVWWRSARQRVNCYAAAEASTDVVDVGCGGFSSFRKPEGSSQLRCRRLLGQSTCPPGSLMLVKLTSSSQLRYPTVNGPERPLPSTRLRRYRSRTGEL